MIRSLFFPEGGSLFFPEGGSLFLEGIPFFGQQNNSFC